MQMKVFEETAVLCHTVSYLSYQTFINWHFCPTEMSEVFKIVGREKILVLYTKGETRCKHR